MLKLDTISRPFTKYRGQIIKITGFMGQNILVGTLWPSWNSIFSTFFHDYLKHLRMTHFTEYLSISGQLSNLKWRFCVFLDPVFWHTHTHTRTHTHTHTHKQINVTPKAFVIMKDYDVKFWSHIQCQKDFLWTERKDMSQGHQRAWANNSQNALNTFSIISKATFPVFEWKTIIFVFLSFCLRVCFTLCNWQISRNTLHKTGAISET